MTTHYDDLPDRVRDAATPADEWEVGDPTEIRTDECAACGDGLFWIELPEDADESCFACGQHHGPVESHGEPVNDWGEPTHAEYVGGEIYRLAGGADSGIMCGGCYENFSYHPDGTVVVAYGDGETVKATHLGGVYRYDGDPYREEPPGEILDVIEAVVEGTHYVSVDAWRGHTDGPSEAADLVKVSGGWHSSMERSELSDRINDITAGDMHVDSFVYQQIEADDAVDAMLGGGLDDEDVDEVVEEGVGWGFPVAVAFGSSSNVCSTVMDVYAPPEHVETVDAYLSGATAAPGYAGLR